ncbi:MAG TPA: hypothetical protein GXZ58_09460 [Bacilli bacterium]|nr:hypothetical protein [Bacilli bacterium]
MIQKLTNKHHKQPFRGPISITRIEPGKIFNDDRKDPAFGPLSTIDHAVMQKNLTIKMHEHVNDEILSYVWRGTIHHRDSAGKEAPVTRGNLMMMNAGESFWHEEKVTDEQVEMLQIFVRPKEANLKPMIQFQDKEPNNRDWYVMVGPEESDAPLHVRQNVYILDAHPKVGEQLKVPVYQGYQPFLYVMDGAVTIGDLTVEKQEAVTDVVNPLPTVTAIRDTTLVLFFVDFNAPMSFAGTISGLK